MKTASQTRFQQEHAEGMEMGRKSTISAASVPSSSTPARSGLAARERKDRKGMNTTTTLEWDRSLRQSREPDTLSGSLNSGRSWSAVADPAAAGGDTAFRLPTKVQKRRGALLPAALQDRLGSRSRLCVFCVLLWLTMLFAGSASAATHYVWQSSPFPLPPYTSWATAAINGDWANQLDPPPPPVIGD
jgi:hypothetical protein